MSDDPAALQFDRAEAKAAAPAGCVSCKQPFADVYYSLQGRTICLACRDLIQQSLTGGSAGIRFLRACAGGVAGGVAGAALWYGVWAASGYQLGLVAIVVGILVGQGVRWGAENRGGWFYQLLAMVLAYLAIAATYIPQILELAADSGKPGFAVVLANAGPNPAAVIDLLARANGGNREEAEQLAVSGGAVGRGRPVEELRALMGELQAAGATATVEENSPPPRILVIALCCVLSLAAPVFSGLMGIIIVGIALHQAWVANKRVVLEFTGPHRIAAAPQADGAGA